MLRLHPAGRRQLTSAREHAVRAVQPNLDRAAVLARCPRFEEMNAAFMPLRSASRKRSQSLSCTSSPSCTSSLSCISRHAHLLFSTDVPCTLCAHYHSYYFSIKLYPVRYCSGVIPSCLRKVATKWLASRNPHASPTDFTDRDRSLSKSSFALRMRRLIKY